MAEATAISWADSTWTPIRARRFVMLDDGGGKERIGWHCEHVSPGCIHCYAERMNKFVGTGQEFKPAHLVHVTRLGEVRGDVTVFLDEEMLLRPLKWKRGRMIFVCSMTDLFADFVSDEIVDRVFAVMALAPQHTYQVLTKRAPRMRAYFDNPMREALIGRQVGLIELARTGNPISEWSGLPIPHVWLGVSCEDQQRADERIVELLATLAAVRFLSVEPMLGPVDLERIHRPRGIAPSDTFDCTAPWGTREQIDWVICGGESGPLARPSHPDWFRSLRDQCAAAGVPFHFKQWGEWHEQDDSGLPGVRHVVEGDPEFESEANKCDAFMSLDGEVVANIDDGRIGVRYRGLERIGTKAAGRLLDGRLHDEFPTPIGAPHA